MALREFLHDLAENHLRTVATSGWQVVAAEPCELESSNSDATPGQRGTSNATMDSDTAAHSAAQDSDMAVSNSSGGGIMALLDDDSGPDSAQAQASHTMLVRIERGFAPGGMQRGWQNQDPPPCALRRASRARCTIALVQKSVTCKGGMLGTVPPMAELSRTSEALRLRPFHVHLPQLCTASPKCSWWGY